MRVNLPNPSIYKSIATAVFALALSAAAGPKLSMMECVDIGSVEVGSSIERQVPISNTRDDIIGAPVFSLTVQWPWRRDCPQKIYQECKRRLRFWTHWADKVVGPSEWVAIDINGIDESNPIKTYDEAREEINNELLLKFKELLGEGKK